MMRSLDREEKETFEKYYELKMQCADTFAKGIGGEMHAMIRTARKEKKFLLLDFIAEKLEEEKNQRFVCTD